MSSKAKSPQKSDESIWEGNETIWHAWGPECDACGLRGSSLKKAAKGEQLLSCSTCLVAKYCSKKCQKQDWAKRHKNECHLFEANRKLSSVFAKSLGPGTINDPKLTLAEKLQQWNYLNIANHFIIAAAAMKNDPKFAGTVNVALLLSMAGNRAGSKYENRTFFIDRVVLLSRKASDAAVQSWDWAGGNQKDLRSAVERTDTNQFKLMAGWCDLGGETPGAQMWTFETSKVAEHVLPPGFDLNRYVTHVNRGITHFHASFWPLPRSMSDADVESAEVPAGWRDYAERQHQALSGLRGGQDLVDHLYPDGTRVPMYKGSNGGHFRRCASGETDFDGADEYKKSLVDPSRMVRLLSKHLQAFEKEQRLKFEENIQIHPSMTLEEAKNLYFPER
ncbi:hypothetical protein C8R43DRAFT_975879 [Mycena crocata]|nr:hypothetical protein C8R43DRAFT_975879 [Mycena crocata]